MMSVTAALLRRGCTVLLVLLVLWSAPLCAAEGDFCAERPGQTTPSCVMPARAVMLESALATFSVTTDDTTRTSALSYANSLVRVGLGGRTEAQLGWTPVSVVRQRDLSSGETVSHERVGNLYFGLLHGLKGEGGPIALQGGVSLTVQALSDGRRPWAADLRLPVSLPAVRGIQLAVTPEVDALVNLSGAGEHFAYGGAFGGGVAVGRGLQLGADVAFFDDQDPDAVTRRDIGGASLAWQARRTTQFDVGAAVELQRHQPDWQVYLGVAHQF